MNFILYPSATLEAPAEVKTFPCAGALWVRGELPQRC